MNSDILDQLDITWSTNPVLQPGVDWHDPTLFFTVPVPSHKVVTVGKGKAAREVRKPVTATIAVGSDRSLIPYDAETLPEYGFTFPTTFTTQETTRWPLTGECSVRDWLEGKSPELGTKDVFDELRTHYHTYLEFTHDTLYDILPLYVMATYLFRLWPSIGYLHLNGTRASGKSQCLQTLEAFALNTILASNTSTAALFRTTAGIPGLTCIDEAEQLSSEHGQELRLLLNAAYKQGGTVRRTEKGANDAFQTITYPVYGPKVLASINVLEPVLQSRCIVVPTQPALRKVPAFDPNNPEWPFVRARLYTWALQHAERVARHTQLWRDQLHEQRAPKLLARQWEISQALVVLADYVGGAAVADPIIEYLNDYFAMLQANQDETDRTRLCLKVLPRVLATQTVDKAPDWYSLKTIHEVFVSYLEEDVRENTKTRGVSKYLAALGFNKREVSKGGTLIRLNATEIREQFRKRRVEPFPEDQPWFERQGDEPPHHPTKSDPFAWADQLLEESPWTTAQPS